MFEVYFRKLPFDGGYAVFAGLERVVHYVQNLHFGEEEIAYLREQEENYKEEFLDALRAVSFKGDMQAVPEGTLVFPNVPLVRVIGSIFEAQLVETAILNFVNLPDAHRDESIAHEEACSARCAAGVRHPPRPGG